jgi:hypothetical protein
MRRTSTAFALVAVVAVLAGCAAPPGPPPPPTDQEVAALVHEQDVAWWHAMFPDQDPPEVEVIGAATWEDQSRLVSACVAKEQLPGFDRNGFAWNFVTADPAVQDRFNRAIWMCTVAYPVDDAVVGMLSRDQLDWFYDFLVNRHQPCMAALGYRLLGIPDKETFLRESAGFPIWFPSPELIDPPVQPGDLARVDRSCPLPEMVDHLVMRM